MPIETLNLREVMVFLVAAGVVVPLFRRLQVSPVLGFLAVGVVIGPHGLAQFADSAPWLLYAVIEDMHGVHALAELGVVFLLFMIGLELSVQRLWAMRRLVFGLGGAQVIVTGVVIAGIASVFDNTLPTAMVLGGGFALSSTAIVMQLLAENRRMGSETGRVSFAILLFQDLAVLPILFMVAAFGAESDGSPVLSFLLAIGQAAVAVAVILVVGRLVIRPLFRFVGGAASHEMFLALVLLVIIGTAVGTSQVGLSMALGAFLAGLLFSETEYRHQIEVDIEPFKGLLLGLFFVSVGMEIDVSHIIGDPLWLILSVFGLFAIKGVILFGLARLFGEPTAVAAELALLLGQGGEFALLIVGMASTLGFMPSDTAQFMLIVTSMTMAVTPLVAQGARRLGNALEAHHVRDGRREIEMAADMSGHIIVVGYGRVGQTVGTILESHEQPHIGIDKDPQLVAGFRAKGIAVFFGDASRPEMLKRFGIDKAAALVVTLDHAEAAAQIVAIARQNWSGIPIYARAHDMEHAKDLIMLGASHVIPETMEASLQLGELVLQETGIPDAAARHAIDVHRSTIQAVLGRR